MAYRWVGSHAFRDHANDRVIEPGEELPEDIAEDVASSHPYDVEAIDEDEGGETEDEICGFEKDDDTVCQREAGWGRDADSGRCKDHVDE